LLCPRNAGYLIYSENSLNRGAQLAVLNGVLILLAYLDILSRFEHDIAI